MAKKPPSYTELVYEVLRESPEPLTSREILAQVEERRPVTTRNPIGTIRNALSQAWSLVRAPGAGYVYLPRFLSGSLLRLPLTESDPANHPLIYPDEVLLALFPTFHENGSRQDRTPAQATLPNGEEVLLALDFMGRGIWGSRMHEGLHRFLVSQHAGPGDALVVRVVDAVARRYELGWEPRSQRHEAAIAARNRQLAEAAVEVLRKEPVPTMDLRTARLLMARGVYHDDVAPDILNDVLGADPRFRKQGMMGWAYVEGMSAQEIAEFDAHGRRMAAIFDDYFPDDEEPTADDAALAGRPSTMERALADFDAAIEGMEFSSVEELGAFIEGLLVEGELPHQEPQTPQERAQDLIYDAWDAPTPRARIRFARQALKIWPDAADAYVILAEETARDAQQAYDLYAAGVEAGERALGPEVFEQAVGAFWGILETRPYMRAKEGLAHMLWEMGRREEAIATAQEMLRLNPSDNQGMRYILLGWLLEEGRDEETETLLSLYGDDIVASWAYGRALHAFRREGDSRVARGLLGDAQRANPHVIDYLLSRRELPEELPEVVGLGDEREAQGVAYEQGMAWVNTEGAVEWLARRAG